MGPLQYFYKIKVGFNKMLLEFGRIIDSLKLKYTKRGSDEILNLLQIALHNNNNIIYSPRGS